MEKKDYIIDINVLSGDLIQTNLIAKHSDEEHIYVIDIRETSEQHSTMIASFYHIK